MDQKGFVKDAVCTLKFLGHDSLLTRIEGRVQGHQECLQVLTHASNEGESSRCPNNWNPD